MNFWKEYFSFNKRERNGVIVLLFIMLILIIVNQAIDYFPPNPHSSELNKFKQEVDNFISTLTPENESTETRIDNYIIERYDSLKLFPFDPNSTTKENWLKLGFSEKQVATINNYLAHGGKFTEKTDLQKIFGIRQKQYEIVEPYIKIAQSQKQNERNEIKNNETQYFDFDPNTITDEEWLKLGFSEKQTKVLRNYIAKGGKFKTKEDVKKMFVVSPDKYIEIEPFIKIAENKILEEIVQVELNSSDTTELLKIKGLYSQKAKAIIKYRELLGGYTNKEQLLEVYGMTSELAEKISKSIIINTQKINKININFVSLKNFRHPYLTFAKAKLIIDYRTKNGAFSSIEILLSKQLLNADEFAKLKPYLTI